MIDAMASRNRPPRLVPLGDATVPLFEKAYDWSEQQRVRRAMDAVARIRSDEAWWQLRERIHDGRYVLTAARGGVTRNFTLGAICSDILDSRLCLAFVSHLPSVPGRLPASFQPEEEYWRHEAEWAARRAPLYAMQAALCQRAIEQWDAVAGTLPGSDGQSHVYTADEKARYVAALKKEIARRKETKKAAYEEVVGPGYRLQTAGKGLMPSGPKRRGPSTNGRLPRPTESGMHWRRPDFAARPGMSPQVHLASPHAALDLRDQFAFLACGDFLRTYGFPVVHVDCSPAGEFSRSRPGVEGALDGHGEDRRIGVRGQHREARPKCGNLAVRRPPPFRKNQHHLATFQAAERLLDARQPQSVAVDRNGVQRANQPAQRGKVEESLTGQIVRCRRCNPPQ